MEMQRFIFEHIRHLAIAAAVVSLRGGPGFGDDPSAQPHSAAAQTQPTAPPAQVSADQKPKYTPEQQLDRTNELLTRVSKLNDQGKYADAIPLASEALKLREAFELSGDWR